MTLTYFSRSKMSKYVPCFLDNISELWVLEWWPLPTFQGHSYQNMSVCFQVIYLWTWVQGLWKLVSSLIAISLRLSAKMSDLDLLFEFIAVNIRTFVHGHRFQDHFFANIGSEIVKFVAQPYGHKSYTKVLR